MHVSNGDPLLVHLMMLHEVRSQQVFEIRRFLFKIQGMQLDFSETEYILISNLRVGPCVDLLHDERGRSNSNLSTRLFPHITDARLHGQDVKTSILAEVYKLADNIDDWNRDFWSWILNHEESPPRQHSPSIVALPPRRNKYKSETSSTETATNASTSQPPEIERTYISSDASTRSVKKKKTSTKSLVKRLIGVVADLTSKVNRVLQKKYELDTGFGEEEDMVNEEEEETYYHGIQLHYDDTSTHGLEGDAAKKEECCMVSTDVVHSDAIHTKIEENHQNKEKKSIVVS
ncbi:unnamed protein product [Lactuca saligna]|uniref:Uncharacterized protein n=1 Tax=Lactuca saligna TaxID=75948 RepID=A0AA35YAZ9_LACSI|nr:unnamed protein product [Lactuca saligna]